MIRCWLVGQNEFSILGEGWYDRAPDWFGLPFRESFPQASLKLPADAGEEKLTFVLASALAVHTGSQRVVIRIGGSATAHVLKPPSVNREWQAVTVRVSRERCLGSDLHVELEAEGWRHGQYESVKDFREVGILFAGVFVE